MSQSHGQLSVAPGGPCGPEGGLRVHPRRGQVAEPGLADGDLAQQPAARGVGRVEVAARRGMPVARVALTGATETSSRRDHGIGVGSDTDPGQPAAQDQGGVEQGPIELVRNPGALGVGPVLPLRGDRGVELPDRIRREAYRCRMVMGESAFESPDRCDRREFALQMIRYGGQRATDHGPVTGGEQSDPVLAEQSDQPSGVVQPARVMHRTRRVSAHQVVLHDPDLGCGVQGVVLPPTITRRRSSSTRSGW